MQPTIKNMSTAGESRSAMANNFRSYMTLNRRSEKAPTTERGRARFSHEMDNMLIDLKEIPEMADPQKELSAKPSNVEGFSLHASQKLCNGSEFPKKISTERYDATPKNGKTYKLDPDSQSDDSVSAPSDGGIPDSYPRTG